MGLPSRVISRTTARFRRAYAALPAHVRVAYRTFQRDPSYPGRRLKQVHTSQPVYSARVGLGYRALAVRHGEVWVWFWIGAHAD